MPKVINISWDEVKERARRVAQLINMDQSLPDKVLLHGVPNGGIIPSLLVEQLIPMARQAGHPGTADVFIDDIIDSGKTYELFKAQYPRNFRFYALWNKQEEQLTDWLSFPWERAQKEKVDGPQDNIRRILQYIGEDVEREGLRDTPERVVRSYAELFSGYKQDPKDVMKTFVDGKCDEMVVLKNVEFFSTCEHHLLPFTGKAHIAYIPKDRILGLSKLARLLEIYSRRLQVQERLTQQITSSLDEHLKPAGSACVIEASHSCMTCRGVGKQHASMITSSLTGVFRQPEVRAEFFQLVRG